jgi:hypothetical protein
MLKKGIFRAGFGLLFALQGLTTSSLHAAEVCPAYALKTENGGNPGNIEGNNNDQVLHWKVNSKNQFRDRARVQGKIVRVYPDRNGHEHFSIQIGPQSTDTVEIVYNQQFGAVPDPQVGVEVEACGDYITSTAVSPAPRGGSYPASPDGAIVHWVHFAPARSGHTSGYLVIGGVLTGRGNSHGLQ